MANLVVSNLELSVRDKVLIKSFSLTFSPGKIYALVGDNGSGKTTLLKTLAGLNYFGPNHVLINGDDIYGLAPKNRAQIISFLMQHSPEQPYCTALSRIAHGLMPTLGYYHFLDQATCSLIELTARRLNIQHLLHRVLSKMSGGEQRLVHIAKCLISPSTKILLLDEPSVFLDFTQQANLESNLNDQKSLGRLVIFSSHDAEFIRRCADEVVRIKDCEITAYPHKPSSFSDLSNSDEMAVLAKTPS